MEQRQNWLQKETYSSPVDFRTGRQRGHSSDFCSVTAFLVIQERADWKITRFLCYFLYLMEATYTGRIYLTQNQRAQSAYLGRDSWQRSLAVFLASQWTGCKEWMLPLSWFSPLPSFFPQGLQSVGLHHLMTNIKVSLSPQLILSETTTMNILRMWHQTPRRFQIQSS